MAQRIPQKLNGRQERAIIALLNEPNVQRAALAAKVGERTLHRWMREPMFAAAYREARRDTFSQAIGLTQRYAQLAVNTLARVMMNGDAATTAHVSAAVAMLRFGREGMDLDDLAVRVEALEQAAKEKGLEQCGSRARFN